VEEATQIARAALPLACKLNLPANPVNYAVLYEYMAGHNTELKTALDRLRIKPDRLTSECIHSLYQEYISQGDGVVLDDLRNTLVTMIDSIHSSVQRMDTETQKYESGLDQGARDLNAVDDRSELMTITGRLIAETRHMQMTSKLLNEELGKVTHELAQLREEYQRVRSEALEDPVTGIKNRRAFNNTIASLCDVAKTAGKPLSLLMVDIDHFKRVNDTYGHVTGDAVLKWIAQVINSQVRGGDFLARYGGEEFAVLLQDTTLAGAEKVAEHIRRKTESQKLKHSEFGHNIGAITVSIGLTIYERGEDVDAFIERADDALYHAKQGGRNRVCKLVAQKNVA
jgi:diguanylate cyclase